MAEAVRAVVEGRHAARLAVGLDRDYIDLEPVEFTGFKLFFHNDVKHHDALLTAAELLRLRPRPLYIQYQ